MNRVVAAFLALVLSAANALARDMVTLKGETYREFTILAVDPNGLKIMHRDGIALVPVANLPEELRKEFYPESTASAQPKASPTPPAQIVTLSGDVYYNVKIIRVEKSGIRISHRDGAAFLDFQKLAVSLRLQFGYDDKAYAEGKLERERAVARAAEQRQAAKDAAIAAQVRNVASDTTPRDRNGNVLTEDTFVANRSYSTANYATRNYVAERYERPSYTGGIVYVHGYCRKNGTYVRPHTRRR